MTTWPSLTGRASIGREVRATTRSQGVVPTLCSSNRTLDPAWSVARVIPSSLISPVMLVAAPRHAAARRPTRAVAALLVFMTRRRSVRPVVSCAVPGHRPGAGQRESGITAPNGRFGLDRRGPEASAGATQERSRCTLTAAEMACDLLTGRPMSCHQQGNAVGCRQRRQGNLELVVPLAQDGDGVRLGRPVGANETGRK